jgi:5-(aminomethyl)-3-furanmethanol phosphate kinase
VSDAHPIVVKIGGGLLRAEGLEGLRRACAEVRSMAGARPVLVVPGGGPFADAVRAVDAQVGLPDAIAHELALRAMDQLGALLAPLLPGAEPLTELRAPRSIGLLVAAPAFAGRPDVPESWDVTSDSLAVLAAAAIGADEAILLKPVDGAAVDAYLPEAVRRTGVGVTVRAPRITLG